MSRQGFIKVRPNITQPAFCILHNGEVVRIQKFANYRKIYPLNGVDSNWHLYIVWIPTDLVQWLKDEIGMTNLNNLTHNFIGFDIGDLLSDPYFGDKLGKFTEDEIEKYIIKRFQLGASVI